jgi:hypothetical protein
MGTRRYHGPVRTVEQAMFADMPVSITCLRCSRFRKMHAYQLLRLDRRTAEMPLWKPVSGFYCKLCRRKVMVMITAPMHWA